MIKVKIKSKTIYDLASEKGFTRISDLDKFLKGKMLRTNGVNRSGHGYPKTFKVTSINPAYNNYTITANQGIQFCINGLSTFYGTTIYLTEIELDSVGIDTLEKEIQLTSNSVKELTRQLQVCKELGITEYDEKLIKTIVAIETIKSTKTKDKVKEAQSLIEILES
jgi:hypothetical protein